MPSWKANGMATSSLSRAPAVPHGRSSRRRVAGRLGIGLTALAAAVAVPATSAGASASSTWYVSTHGQDSSSCGQVDHPCRTIAAAVARAQSGDTVRVASGTYHEQVVLTHRLTLTGDHATIDATGLSSGSGMTMNASGLLITASASWSTVQGFTVSGAFGEGILVMGASHVLVRHDVVTKNDLGTPATTAYGECQTQGEIPGDCGEGLHLMSATDSRVEDNVVTWNSGGILVTDELGPATKNMITGNRVTDNVADCGITMPSHNPKALSATGARQPDQAGVYGNDVESNVVLRNGIKGAGAGILLAAAGPGMASYDNRIVGNVIAGNGEPGVTVHSHTPNQDVSGNVIARNHIGRNNVLGDSDAGDMKTTGILIFSAVVPTTEVLANNHIHGNQIPVWKSANVTIH
jgi:nitrous oxidase accessory protein NosD